MKTRVDPELYARLIQPRPKADTDAAMASFDEELYALRVKHGIADLTWIAAVSQESDGPEEYKVIVHHGHYGNSAHALPMAGAVFAQLRAEQDEKTLAMAGIVPKKSRKRPR